MYFVYFVFLYIFYIPVIMLTNCGSIECVCVCVIIIFTIVCPRLEVFILLVEWGCTELKTSKYHVCLWIQCHIFFMSFTCFVPNSCNCLLGCVIYVRTCNCYVWNYYHCLVEKKHTFAGMLSIWGYISNKSKDNFLHSLHVAQALRWQLLTGMMVVCLIKIFFCNLSSCAHAYVCVHVCARMSEWVSDRQVDGLLFCTIS